MDNKKHFSCSAPFVGMSFLGSVRPCCQIELKLNEHNITDCNKSLDYYKTERKQIQEKFIEDNFHPKCEICLSQQSTYASFFNKYWKIEKDNYLTDQIKHLHIQFNNKCNLACRMCSGLFSNLHTKEAGGSGNIKHSIPLGSTLYNDLVDSIDQIEYLYLTGGESFVDPTSWEFLQRCVDKDRAKYIHLQVNTNGTVKLNSEQLNILKQFKRANIHLSIDGIGSMAEYTRTGLVWDKWIKNLDRYVENFGRDDITIVYTVSVLNIWQFSNDIEFFKSKGLNTHWQVLTHPSGLSIANLPNKTKIYLKRKYENHKYKAVLNTMYNKSIIKENVSTAILKLDQRAIKYGKWPNYKYYHERFPDYWKLITAS